METVLKDYAETLAPNLFSSGIAGTEILIRFPDSIKGMHINFPVPLIQEMQDAKGTNNRIMKLVEIKIRRFKELVKGILLGSGTEWSLIRLNVVDYVLDGYQFTNKKFVVYESEILENTMLHRILSIKNKTEDIPPFKDINILDDNELLFSFFKRNELLVAICLHHEDILYVGKIKEIRHKTFVFDTYNTELQRSGVLNIDYSKVRYIQMHTDYLDSLCLLLDHIQSQES